MEQQVELLEIKDMDPDFGGKVLLNALPIIINILETSGAEYSWSVYDLDAVGLLDGPLTTGKIMQQSRTLPLGLTMQLPDLQSIFSQFDDVWNVILVGYKGDHPLADINEGACASAKDFDVVIECFDSTYWSFFSEDENLMVSVAKRFKNCERLDRLLPEIYGKFEVPNSGDSR